MFTFIIALWAMMATAIAVVATVVATERRQRVKTLERQYGVSHVLGEPSSSPDQDTDGT